MAQPTVKTVQFVDPRIEPQPDPLYEYIISPTQNQYYKLKASGLSDTSITFNNFTTLGIDRAYLDTFEIEITATITFHLENIRTPVGAGEGNFRADADIIRPAINAWTFQSFPFNTVCEEARININGGAFFSQPLSYIRAKERYMDETKLSNCYENVCPIHKPHLQYESGRDFNGTNVMAQIRSNFETMERIVSGSLCTPPTRYGFNTKGFMQSSQGMSGGFNNSIIKFGPLRQDGSTGYDNYYREGNNVVCKVTWREPIFCSPFSSRYDATYGRPLYNITSMDFAFNLQNLGNMIRISNLTDRYNAEGLLPANAPTYANVKVTSYDIHIDEAQICYQVMTIPPNIQKPLTTLVPYRRFVPYITEIPQPIPQAGTPSPLTIRSGTYTLNEIPTAIWLFVAPVKARYQTNEEDKDGLVTEANINDTSTFGNWESNKLFAYIQRINLTLANTTQILTTAEPPDLYRIAKANGCEDSYLSWHDCNNTFTPSSFVHGLGVNGVRIPPPYYNGAGSVLRLKPGVDIIIPDMPLIPGANANNMVFQAEATVTFPTNSTAQNKYALWLLFEYVGVASISPGQCEITMNPLGSGEIMGVSPVMSATSEATEGNLEGSGFWDKTRRNAKIAGSIADEGIISKILKHIPGAEGAANWAAKHGLGEPGTKRARGGAVMGRGLNDWV